MLEPIITQSGPNGPTVTPNDCEGEPVPFIPPTKSATSQAIAWARRSIGCLLWGEPPLGTLDAPRLEAALTILEQMQATLKPLQPSPAMPSNAAAFCHAFDTDAVPPAKSHRYITDHWREQTTVTIDALVEFRSAIHRWHAAGHVPDSELFAAVERLELVGLGAWFDHLVCIALVAEMIEEDLDG